MDTLTQLQQIDPLYIQLLFIGLSVLIIILEIPLALNRVEPNSNYGFRVQKTLSDERIWYLANSYCGKRSILFGIITAVTAIVLRLFAMSPVTYGLICSLVFLGGLGLTIVGTLIYIKRIS